MEEKESSKLLEFTYDNVYNKFVELLNSELKEQLETPYTRESLKNSNIGSFITTLVKNFLMSRNYLLSIEGLVRHNIVDAKSGMVYTGGCSVKGLTEGLKKLTYQNEKILTYIKIASKNVLYPQVEKGTFIVAVEFNKKFEDNTAIQRMVTDFLGNNAGAGILAVPYKNHKKVITNDFFQDGMVAPIQVTINLVERINILIRFKGSVYGSTPPNETYESNIRKIMIKSYESYKEDAIISSHMFFSDPVFNEITDKSLVLSYKTKNDKNEEVEINIDITKDFYVINPVQIINIKDILVDLTAKDKL